MARYSFPMEFKKEGAHSLRTKMRNAELYLKEATVIYGFAARLPELARALKLLIRLLPLVQFQRRSKLSTDYWSSERSYEIVEVRFAVMTGAAVATKEASVTKLHASVV